MRSVHRLGLPASILTIALSITSTWGAEPPSYVWNALSKPFVRERLSAEQLGWLDRNIQVSPRTTVFEDRYWILEGCRQHQCDLVAGFVVIDVKAKTLFVARTEAGKSGIAIEGESDVHLPPNIGRMYEEWATRLR